MIAIATLLLDSYRLLKARALFWITLSISGLVGFLYLSIGFNEDGMSLFFGLVSFEHELFRKGSEWAELLYIGIFTKFIVPLWITWIAIILGLISTASIFPDFMSEGSIELSLSKPVSRLKIFLTKYLGSLLFMLIQVGLFTVLVFFALKLRMGTWNPSVLWMVPLSLLVFSYLYAVVVLVTVITKSTLAGILFALLIWFGSFIMNAVEGNLYAAAYTQSQGGDAEMQENLKPWYRASVALYTVLPKTKQTIEFGDRLITVGGQKGFSTEDFTAALLGAEADREDLEGIDDAVRRNSGFYVIGTSLIFEGVVLSLAGWLFCRRDF